jgi:alginate O-acetyltransferase complex protein AlgI
MVFSSLEFLLRFLPAFLLLYFVAPRRLRNPLLLAASLFFYAWGEPVYIALMIVSSLGNYALGIAIDRWRGAARSKTALVCSIAFNLLLLGLFKYADFLITNVNSLFGWGIGLLRLPLPIGISFYTFQALSYTIDIYRNTAPVQKNPVALATYITMFPQLIAGPIVRYPTISEEIENRGHSLELFAEGVHRFVIGLGKKVLIADNVARLWTTARTTEAPSTLLSWLGIVAFGLQMYFDFSGYSDMAIGLGRMLGFRLPENFDYPYIARTVTEFWRRWHMTLGQWFRDYVYIPLGGNRVSRARWVGNILIVWFLTGIWHGPSWSFALWGLYFGLLLMMEKAFLRKVLEGLPGVFGHAYTLLALTIGWLIFETRSVSGIVAYLGQMAGMTGIEGWNSEALYALRSNGILLLIAAIGCTPLFRNAHRRIATKAWVRTAVMPVYHVVVLTLSIAYVVDASFSPFLYFRF